MHSRGFTLVELILVIVVIGILAAVVGPRFFDRRVFDERMFYEESLSAVRYAQKLALASGCPIRVQVSQTAVSLSHAAACGAVLAGRPVADLAGGTYPDPMTAADLDLVFNSLGCVAQPANYRECAGGAVPVSLAGGFSFTVHAATGFVEAM